METKTNNQVTEHPILGTPLDHALASGQEEIFLAAGCFWGVERIFWQTPGVKATAVGYMGGTTPNPTYAQVGMGNTGHAETVRVVYDPEEVSTGAIVGIYFENHDPTQINRQGNDIGSQYRSAIWTTTDAQFVLAQEMKDAYEKKLVAAGLPAIATQLHAPPAPSFHLAEDYHQAYLHWNPQGYCNHGFNGFSCPRPA